jgi:F-type H+-transporting ATPase subunit b
MLIDWFTVGAQALNFLILVWLMKRFLYQPILNAIDARETLIAKQLADADKKKSQAQQERDEFEQKNASFDQQHATRLSDMNKEVLDERKRLLGEARQAAQELTSKRMTSLQQEAIKLSLDLRQRTQDEVFAIVRQTLNDLASVNLEQQMTEVFTQQLHSLDDEAKTKLSKALNNHTKSNPAFSPAIIHSVFELTPEQSNLIQDTINQTFSADIALRFETAPDLVSGIELLASGQKLAWSISDYLKTLEQEVTDILKSREVTKNPDKAKAQTQADDKQQIEADTNLGSSPEPEAQPSTEIALTTKAQ